MCFNECIMTSYVMRQLHEDRNDKNITSWI